MSYDSWKENEPEEFADGYCDRCGDMCREDEYGWFEGDYCCLDCIEKLTAEDNNDEDL